MSTDTVANAVDEATAEEPKKTRKSRGPRKRTAFGREGLVLKKLDVPENGYPPETTITDFDCHRNALPQHTDFQDPIDYHRFLLDTLAPQITQLATAAIEKMSKIGDAKARQDVNAVGGSIEATAAMIKELGADASPEAKEAMLADLAAMMASVRDSMQASTQG